MTKYGSFRTSLNGATGAIVGISSSLVLPLLLISSSESPGIPEPLRLITSPFEFLNVIYFDTKARSLCFLSEAGPVSANLSFWVLFCLLYAVIASFMVATVRSPCAPVLRVTWYSNLGPPEEDAAPGCGGTSPMSLPILKCCAPLVWDVSKKGLPRRLTLI